MLDYKHTVFYQIYPRSFKDSNNDGIGDIQGIIEEIPYLEWLGIKAIWLSPIYESPNDDYGYDVSDYYKINPEYGTMDDFKQLIKVAKDHGIAIVLDFIANHTSTQHKWFKEALNNPNSPYRDYYYFRKGTKSTPPNNWLSFFGGSAWQKAEDDMWYLTLYTKTQADLNWSNPKVRKEIEAIMNYYLDLGVEGFRLDTINTIDKPDDLPSVKTWKPTPQFPEEYILNGPRVMDYLKELHETVFKPHDAFALGEGVLIDIDSAIQYCSGKDAPLDLIFQFDLATLGYGKLGKYDPRKFYRITPKDMKDAIRPWQHAMKKHKFMIGNYISNHDHKRPIGRFVDESEEFRRKGAKALAVFNFAQFGVPFIYQGEELAMTNPTLTKKDWKDSETFTASKAMTKLLLIPPFAAEKIASLMTRDNARSPMQWNKQLNAGFSSTKPWMKMCDDYEHINVEVEKEDSDSTLRFYRRLIQIHEKTACLSEGVFIEVIKDHPNVFACYRFCKDEYAFIIVNLTNEIQSVDLPERTLYDMHNKKSLLTNYKPILLQENLVLEPYESHIFLKKGSHM